MMYHLAMSVAVQVFSCPRCNRGGFRSLPGPDGKAHCPWCGDRVASGTDLPLPPAPEPAATASPADRLGDDASEIAVRALRDRVAELERKCQLAEADLRRELDKKQEIKRAVLAEMGQLSSQLTESKALLKQKGDDLDAARAEMKRLKEDLASERKRADDMLGDRRSLEEKEQTTWRLGVELEASRTAAHDLQVARDTAASDAQKFRSELAKAKEAAEAELSELKKRLNSAVVQGRSLKGAGDELKSLKAKFEEYRGSSEKERAELREKAKSLQPELDKKDQRIRELQALIKTLGERLNDLTSRHFGH